MAADDLKAKKGIPCPKCGNRLRVRPDQLGEQVRCPKCNATFTIGKSSPKESAVSADAPYEPERPLKPAAIVPEEPVMLESSAPPEIVPMQAAPTSHLPHYEADWATDELEMEAPQRRRRRTWNPTTWKSPANVDWSARIPNRRFPTGRSSPECIRFPGNCRVLGVGP